MPKSLWLRFFGSYVVVVLLTLSVSGFLTTYLVENLVIRERLRDLTQRATRIAQSYAAGTAWLNIRTRPGGILREVVADEFWVVNHEGIIVASSAPMEGLVGRALPVDEWGRLRQGQTIVNRSTHRLLQRPYLLVGIPVRQRAVTVGAIYIHSPLSGIRVATAQVRRIILLSGLAGVLGSLLVSFWLSKGMIAPLKALSLATACLARADYTASIEPTGIVELDVLGAEFNALSRNLAQAVAQLGQEKEQAQSILQNMSEGVALFGVQGRVLQLNPVAASFLEDDKNHAELSRVVERALSEPNRALVEEEIKVGERSLLARATALSVHNEVSKAVAVLIDISSRRQLEEARSGFVAVVSHELRTPLAHIQGYIEAIIDGVAKDEATQKEYLRIALGETLRLCRLSQDLLTLAQTDAGTLHLHRMDLPTTSFLEEVLHPWRLLAEKRGRTLVEKLEVKGLLQADPDRLKQVLDNLLENAFAHIALGGQVAVMASEDEQAIFITVLDTGRGIPAEALPQIFERFYRVDSARTRQIGGSGLGLSIVKELVELHGGSIAALSQVGQGTSFVITLPKEGDR
ncbi:MAG: HAMP domain-containing protein [Peptococcaceae bacterium]|nr:HAMP domain-containing protein [Peptococcaceae bacterium]